MRSCMHPALQYLLALQDSEHPGEFVSFCRVCERFVVACVVACVVALALPSTHVALYGTADQLSPPASDRWAAHE